MWNRCWTTPSILAITACCWVAPAATAQNTDAAPKPASYRISGTVVSKTDGHPLDRARVLLSNSKSRTDSESFVTSADGKFTFENVGAGKYALEGLKRGFVTAAYDQHDQFSTAIVTGAGIDTENLILRLSPAAVVSGRVLDEAGEPVRQAQVTLYRNNHFQGVDQIVRFGNAPTDDLGAYEFTSLNPGIYFLTVQAQPWYAVHPSSLTDHPGTDGNAGARTTVSRSLDVTYPLTYYENATEPDGATPIQIRGGERLQIDMALNPVPSLRLVFHVPSNSNEGFVVPQLEQPIFDGFASAQTVAQAVSPGVVELTGVPAGRYNIRIQAENTVTQLNGVDLEKDGEEVDASAAEPAGTVKVVVTVPGEASTPAALGVGLIGAKADFREFRQLGPKGEAEIPNISAGTYDVRVFGAAKQYVIVAMSADGAQVKGHSITLPAGASPRVTLTLAVGVDVEGVAKKSAKPFAEAMVVLVPKNAAVDHDLFRRDQSDLDGTFSLRNVVPGSYTLVAIEDGWDLDWSRPEVIAPYVKRGRPIEVRGASSSVVRVKEAIEVQPK